MSTSIGIKGIKPADEKFNQMHTIYQLCKTTGINIPNEVYKFFNDETPCKDGVQVYLNTKEYYDEERYESGYELNVDDIPKDVKILRIYYC